MYYDHDQQSGTGRPRTSTRPPRQTCNTPRRMPNSCRSCQRARSGYPSRITSGSGSVTSDSYSALTAPLDLQMSDKGNLCDAPPPHSARNGSFSHQIETDELNTTTRQPARSLVAFEHLGRPRHHDGLGAVTGHGVTGSHSAPWGGIGGGPSTERCHDAGPVVASARPLV